VSTSEVAEALGHHPQIVEANVYGVELPNHDGRAGCAAMLLKTSRPDQATFDSIAQYTSKNLPRYAAPIFLRIVTEIMATGNNKQQKHVLRLDGVDPAKAGKTDRLYWLSGGTYVPFGEKQWDEIKAGRVKL
jgi:acyl-CoA synthetase (AMP-forming)/AMP-acid ligase II